jgi:hypothetical protein
MHSLSTAELVWVRIMSRGRWEDLLVSDTLRHIADFGGKAVLGDPGKYRFPDASLLKIYDSGIFILH